MPPKKKPAAVVPAIAAVVPAIVPTVAPTANNPVTNNTTNTTTTSSTNNNTTANNTTQSNGSNVGQKKIQWFWAGDSGKKGKTQDLLVEYDSKVNTEIELQYQEYQLKPKSVKLKKYKVDNQRYIDFKKMVQTRYDDESKTRNVERKEIIVGLSSDNKPTKAVSERSKVMGKKRKLNQSDSDESDSDDENSSSSESDSSDSSESDSSDSSDDDDDYHAKWYWAGDSNGGPGNGGGHQDIWIAYDKKFSKKLEESFSNNEKEYKVDKERFIDLQNMLQRRYDDINKRRNVKREDPKKTKPIKPKKKKQLVKPSNGKPTILPISNLTSSLVVPATAGTTTTTTTASVQPTASVSLTNTQLMKALLKCPSTWTDLDSMDYQEVDVNHGEKEFKWMQDLFTSTVSSNHKGVSTLSPIIFNQLKVTRLVRVQNPALWTRYHNRKQKILDDNKGQCPKIKMVLTDLPNGPEVDTKGNEVFLFHGLNTSSVSGIARFGFDPRFCSLEGMFGAGLYFAENSSKSNQYCHAGACTCSGFQATSCRCSASDEMCLLVCRVILGDGLMENVFRGNTPGTFWHGRRTEPKKPDNVSIYNSVIGESKANYGAKASLQLREYIVYESSQVYVEYKVYFKRIK